ncbi:hypothetical protein HYW76_03480 [Candidatus Pacearchaeota archaeon]|nr:hypothetical protein [Candidatus Pacearchaeota archaeon]
MNKERRETRRQLEKLVRDGIFRQVSPYHLERVRVNEETAAPEIKSWERNNVHRAACAFCNNRTYCSAYKNNGSCPLRGIVCKSDKHQGGYEADSPNPMALVMAQHILQNRGYLTPDGRFPETPVELEQKRPGTILAMTGDGKLQRIPNPEEKRKYEEAYPENEFQRALGAYCDSHDCYGKLGGRQCLVKPVLGCTAGGEDRYFAHLDKYLKNRAYEILEEEGLFHPGTKIRRNEQRDGESQ